MTDPAGRGPAGGPAEPAAEGFAVAVTVRLASAGLHVIDRWTDTLLDALQDLGAGEPQVGGSLTSGRIEVHCTVGAAGVPEAAAVAAELLRAALTAATTPGVRVVGLATEVTPDPAGGFGAGGFGAGRDGTGGSGAGEDGAGVSSAGPGPS